MTPMLAFALGMVAGAVFALGALFFVILILARVGGVIEIVESDR